MKNGVKPIYETYQVAKYFDLQYGGILKQGIPEIIGET